MPTRAPERPEFPELAEPLHFFTLTGNLLAERTLEFDRWAPGKTRRALRESFQVGGKGINVSKMLARLGVANTALCFTGGAPGAECEAWLRERKIAFHAFATSQPTRTGTVVRETGANSEKSASRAKRASGERSDEAPAHPETTFLGPDVAPDAAALRACAEFLDRQPPGQLLALCGSFPGWATPASEPLRAALRRRAERGILIADTYGPPLAELAAWPLDLLKINADELRALSPGNPADDFDAQVFDVIAARRVVITDGPRAVRWRDGARRIESLTPPAVQEVSATGSGDVLLACVAEALFRRKTSLREAVAFALPYAAANAAHPGVAEFPFSAS